MWKNDFDLWKKLRFANICPLKTKHTKLKTCQVIGVTTRRLEYKSMNHLGFSTLGAANGKNLDLIFLDVSSRKPPKHSRFLKHTGIPIPMFRSIKLVKNTGFWHIHRNYKQQTRKTRVQFPTRWEDFVSRSLRQDFFGALVSGSCIRPLCKISVFGSLRQNPAKQRVQDLSQHLCVGILLEHLSCTRILTGLSPEIRIFWNHLCKISVSRSSHICIRMS